MKFSSRHYHLLILICFLLYNKNLKAQEQYFIDSLKTANKLEQSKQQIVKNNNEIAFLFGAINLDSSFFYINKARAIAKEIEYKHGLAISYSYEARVHVEKGEIEQAIENYNKSLNIFISEKDSLMILDTYKGMSYIYSYGSSQLNSLDYNLKALKIAESIKDTLSLGTIYNNIGTVYKKLDNYKLALNYFQKSLTLEQNYNIPDNLGVAYSNIGVLKVENGNGKEAFQEYEKVKELLPKIESEYLKSYLYLSLSGYYISIEDFDTAKKYIDLASDLCKLNNFPQIQARVYRKRGELFFNQKSYIQCINFLDKCLDLSNSIGVQEEYPEIYKLKAKAYSQLGMYKHAFKAQLKADNAIDSLKNNRVTSFLKEFEEQKAKSELERTQIEHELNNQQIENASIKTKLKLGYAFAVIILLFLIIVIVSYYFYKSRKNNNILQSRNHIINEQKLQLQNNFKKLELSENNLQKLNATKDKLFSIIAHDLKSPFSSLLGFSQLLSKNYDNYDNDRRKKMIDIIEEASKSTLYLLENLLTWARTQREFIKIDPKNYSLLTLINDGIKAFIANAQVKNIKVVNNISKSAMVFVDKETIKVVISNLFNNAIKFSKVGSEIILTSKVHHNKVEICIEDFGIGMSNEIVNSLFKVGENIKRDGTLNEKGTGLGLIICKEFIIKNKGEIWVTSKEGIGSKFYFSLPLSKS